MSRPPFHTVGILPFALGTIMAYKINFSFSLEVFILGVSGVILIMLSTYHMGEAFDYREDEISHKLYKSKFAGGSGVIPAGDMPRSVALWTGIISFLFAGAIGVILQFVLKTGSYTLLLGVWELFPVSFIPQDP